MVKERGLEGRRGRTEKAESTGNTLRLERGWEEPSSQSELIVTLRGCLCQGDFREVSCPRENVPFNAQVKMSP